MLATSPHEVLPEVENFLSLISADSETLHRFLTTSGATDLYSDLADYIEGEFQELSEAFGEELLTPYQLKCAMDVRFKEIHQQSQLLADERDGVSPSSGTKHSSMMFWNYGSFYNAIIIALDNELQVLKTVPSEVISGWLQQLESSINSIVGSNEVTVVRLHQEAKKDQVAVTQGIEAFSEPMSVAEIDPLQQLFKRLFHKRLQATVISFENKILLDIVSRTHDYFLPGFDSSNLMQQELPAIEVGK